MITVRRWSERELVGVGGSCDSDLPLTHSFSFDCLFFFFFEHTPSAGFPFEYKGNLFLKRCPKKQKTKREEERARVCVCVECPRQRGSRVCVFDWELREGRVVLKCSPRGVLCGLSRTSSPQYKDLHAGGSELL